ncbi:MAG: leucine-rich repeat domain-containing protein [Oscillospiraceae bacterium]|nr:leucine-rich repeat domain-containing protein [Oscillospiraceae bacterium]
MRKILSVIAAAVAAMMLCVPCAADENEIVLPSSEEEEAELDLQKEGDYTYVMLTNAQDSSKRAVCIEKYTGTETNVVLPEEINGYPVVMLGDQCFGGNRIAERIELPKTLEALGTRTFAECTSLKEFAVAEGNTVFEAAEGILYTEGKTVLLRYPAGKKAESYTVPEEITSLGNLAFAYSDMKTITLSDGLQSIGDFAFMDCKNLTDITIPPLVEKIPDYCFYRCKALKTADLNSNITSIGFASFACTNIASIDLPTALVSIGEDAFVDTPMKSITISSKVTDIGYSAFGFKLAADQSLVSSGGFVIRGTPGSAAERYTTDEENMGAATFEPINAVTTTKAVSTQPAQPKDEGVSIGRWIGIIVCSVLLAGIAVVAVVLGVKRRQKPGDDNDAKSEKAEEESE